MAEIDPFSLFVTYTKLVAGSISIPSTSLAFGSFSTLQCCLLPWSSIHHHNGIKDDNRSKNLILTSIWEHHPKYHRENFGQVCGRRNSIDVDAALNRKDVSHITRGCLWLAVYRCNGNGDVQSCKPYSMINSVSMTSV